jgi:acyl carrier protein
VGKRRAVPQCDLMVGIPEITKLAYDQQEGFVQLTADTIEQLARTAGIIGTDIAPLVPTLPLTEQGLDSLDVMSIFLEIEDTYGVQVPDEDYAELRTTEQIVTYLRERLEQ